jgi:acyl carrier protein
MDSSDLQEAYINVLTRAALLDELCTMMELPPGSLRGPERLDALEGWTSLATLSFLAFLSEKFDMTVPARKVIDCKDVNELIALTNISE